LSIDYFDWSYQEIAKFNYERALEDIESLAEIAATPGVECVFFEGFTSAPSELYEEQTGKELDTKATHPSRTRRTSSAGRGICHTLSQAMAEVR
jgi:hypothetical protein